MSYQSPIDVIMGQMHICYENEICKAVQNVGVNVDKNELMKALQYDRGQYQKGYADRDSEIIRCKDCWKRDFDNCPFNEFSLFHPDDDFFCADGER